MEAASIVYIRIVTATSPSSRGGRDHAIGSGLPGARDARRQRGSNRRIRAVAIRVRKNRKRIARNKGEVLRQHPVGAASYTTH